MSRYGAVRGVQVRLAALRAAERDAEHLATLLAAEQDKAAKAERDGGDFDGGLLAELQEVRGRAVARGENPMSTVTGTL